MSLEFNNPLYIGGPGAATKADISQLKQDVGNLDNLETADKSSLVNALNEALDSTLNGAGRDLDNLSDAGNEKLRSLNSYANEGELLTDADGLAFVKNYAHSTFDLSKFTVVGSPTITDDGILSGVSGGGNYVYSSIGDLSSGNFKVSVKHFGQTPWSDGWGLFTIGSSNDHANMPYAIHICAGWNDYRIIVWNNTGSEFLNVTCPSRNTANLQEVTFELNNNVGKLTISYESGEPEELDNIDFTGFGYTNLTNAYLIVGRSAYGGSALINIDLKTLKAIADGVEVFSGNKTGIDTIKPDDYTVVGTPTISADGILTGTTTDLSNCIQKNGFTATNIGKIIVRFKANPSITPVNTNIVNGICWCVLWGGKNMTPHLSTTGGNVNLGYNIPSSVYGKWIDIIWEKVSATQWRSGYKLASDSAFTYGTPVTVENDLSGNSIQFLNRTSGTDSIGFMDLNHCYVYDVNGDLIYQPCLKIPYTESKTGSKIVDAYYRDRVADMSAQFGYANYYTLDEDNGNFTLPQVELYGLIGQRTLRDSYRNGINYWELYSNRDLEQGGSCTSGVEVTFARPFADTNYVLSVPYSAKSSTAFTPTQTGDWIAKGKGVL